MDLKIESKKESYSKERIAKLIYCIEELIKEIKEEIYDC